MKLAKDAVASGMADRIATLDDVLRGSTGAPRFTFTTPPDARAEAEKRRRNIAVQMAEMGLSTLPTPAPKY